MGGAVTKVEKVEHEIILTKDEAVPPTDISDNNSLSGMLIILTKARTVCISSNSFAGRFKY